MKVARILRGRRLRILLAAMFTAAMTTACIAETTAFGEDDGASTSTASGSGSASSGGSGNVGAGASGGSGAVGSGGSGAMNPGTISDPDADGPFGIVEIDDTTTVPATGNAVAIHCAYPDSDAEAPYPIVLVGHGFNLPPSQYYSYLRRLASFGYVAMTVDFAAGFTGADHVANAQELLHGIAWASDHGTIAALADVNRVGTTGHSLGGKVALLAATMDDRVLASATLDPVDGGMNCSADKCPDVSELLPLGIPTAFIGETTDASGSFQACAPSAENFDTFYANADGPSLRVEVLGANHMSFLDDVSSCGLTCNFCNSPTLDNETVNALGRAFVVAFYERHLKGNSAYDVYLTGVEAEARYVTTGLAAIDHKP